MNVTEIIHEYQTSNQTEVKKKEASYAKRYFKNLSEAEQLVTIEALYQTGDYILVSIASSWIKQHPELLNMNYMAVYERILYHNVSTWGICDQFCYRVLNPMVEKNTESFSMIKRWATSDQVYVKRASAVCFLHSSQEFSVRLPFAWVEAICDLLLQEEHIHIKKAVGWLLKYSYVAYPEETCAYLLTRKGTMSRVSYGYALEKMPVELASMLKSKVSNSY